MMPAHNHIGQCQGCHKPLTLANTRHQSRLTPRTTQAPPYCDACREVHGVAEGEIICVMDWRYGRYNEWKVLEKPFYHRSSRSWRVELEKAGDNRSAGPDRHWAYWNGNAWEEGYT